MTVEECGKEEREVVQIYAREFREVLKGPIVHIAAKDNFYQVIGERVLKGDDRLMRYRIPPNYNITRMNGPRTELTHEEYVRMRYSFHRMDHVKHVLDGNLHLQWTRDPDDKVDLSKLEESGNSEYPDWFIIPINFCK